MKAMRLAAWLLGIAAVVILSASLGNLHLRPGAAALFNPWADAPMPSSSSGEGPDLSFVTRILSLVSIVVVVIAVVLNLLSREGRRRVLAFCAAGILILLVAEGLSLLPSRLPAARQEPLATGEDLGGGAPGADFAAVVPARTPPPAWLVAGVAAAAILIAAAGAWAVVSAVRRQRPASVTAQIAEHARAASDALDRGGELRDIILRCYRDMLAVVDTGLGLQRRAAATPSEFALSLERAGLPSAAVRQLTAVFEEVRYGRAAPTHQAEARARESLSAITRYCEALS